MLYSPIRLIPSIVIDYKALEYSEYSKVHNLKKVVIKICRYTYKK